MSQFALNTTETQNRHRNTEETVLDPSVALWISVPLWCGAVKLIHYRLASYLAFTIRPC